LAKEKILEGARRVAEPVLAELGYELVDLTWTQEGGRWYLRYFIDKEGGINISDCETVSRELDTLLEVEDFITGGYSLEVSSPGLDRPLMKPQDYIKFIGKAAKIRTLAPVGGQKVFRGKIENASLSGGFDITVEGGKTVHIEYGQVEKARLEVEF
jgi:ribosome maturation factor RimP